MELVNWQEEHQKWQADGSRGTFLTWLILHALSAAENAHPDRDEANRLYFEELGKATENWTKLEMTLFINGVEVPVRLTLEMIEKHLDDLVAKKAGKLVKLVMEKTSLAPLLAILDRAKWVIQEELRKAGVVTDEE